MAANRSHCRSSVCRVPHLVLLRQPIEPLKTLVEACLDLSKVVDTLSKRSFVLGMSIYHFNSDIDTAVIATAVIFRVCICVRPKSAGTIYNIVECTSNGASHFLGSFACILIIPSCWGQSAFAGTKARISDGLNDCANDLWTKYNDSAENIIAIAMAACRRRRRPPP